MAFTGAGVNTSLGSHCVRIAGLSLAAATSGTIGNNGDATADHQLPIGFVGLNANSTIAIVQLGAAGAINNPIIVTRPTGAPLQVTITNQDAGVASGNFDILVQDLIH